MNEFENKTNQEEDTISTTPATKNEFTPAQEHEEFVEKTESKPVGQIIGIVVIIIVLVIGGLYLYGKNIHKSTMPVVDENVTAEEILAQPDQSVEILQQQSASDEVTDIEADLSITDLDNLDSELGNIDAELGL